MFFALDSCKLYTPLEAEISMKYNRNIGKRWQKQLEHHDYDVHIAQSVIIRACYGVVHFSIA